MSRMDGGGVGQRPRLPNVSRLRAPPTRCQTHDEASLSHVRACVCAPLSVTRGCTPLSSRPSLRPGRDRARGGGGRGEAAGLWGSRAGIRGGGATHCPVCYSGIQGGDARQGDDVGSAGRWHQPAAARDGTQAAAVARGRVYHLCMRTPVGEAPHELIWLPHDLCRRHFTFQIVDADPAGRQRHGTAPGRGDKSCCAHAICHREHSACALWVV